MPIVIIIKNEFAPIAGATATGTNIKTTVTKDMIRAI
jgi:hypothetical protein